jgi:hypothetical protein
MRQRQEQGKVQGQSATGAHHQQFDASAAGSGVTQHAEQLFSLGELRENHFLKQKQQEGGRGCAMSRLVRVLTAAGGGGTQPGTVCVSDTSRGGGFGAPKPKKNKPRDALRRSASALEAACAPGLRRCYSCLYLAALSRCTRRAARPRRSDASLYPWRCPRFFF